MEHSITVSTEVAMRRGVEARFVVVALILLTALGFGQAQTRYRNELFSTYHILSNVQYGQVSSKPLFLDVYTGSGDTVKNRPLVVFIHAGGFQSGDKTSSFAKLVCGALARRGYVAASIDYRLTSAITNDTASFEAMLRALHDAKAAVRFFRKNGTLYGVDTSQIFAAGSSAGSIAALHLAYLDSAEVPGYVNWHNVDTTFEGTSGNPGYSSHVQGVISNWGAIGDTAWIKKGDVPIYCVHGTADSTIYYSLIPAYGPFRYSSKYIFLAARQKGVISGLRLFINAGHELNGDTTKQDSAISDFSAWLSTILKTGTAAVHDKPPIVPAAIALHQNYPNPFNPSTTIRYDLNAQARVTLKLYSMLGQEVMTLVADEQQAGSYVVQLNGQSLASGVYLCRLQAGSVVKTLKLCLMR
jgi:dienelactone hydrolase